MHASTAGRREPIVEMLIPSTLDDALAPPGQHVASLFCQHVAPQSARWPVRGTSHRDERRRPDDRDRRPLCAELQGERASAGRSCRRSISSARFGLVGGDIFHGALSLDQLFSARPMLGHADYRGPLPGLYLCGSGAHPGGGVTGAPGHNAAREILRDLKGWFGRAGFG